MLWILLALVIVLVIVAWFTTDHFHGFGAAPDDEQLARNRRSGHFHDDAFHNPEPTNLMAPGSWWPMIKRAWGGEEMRAPICPLPLVTDAAWRLTHAPESGLRVTWLGHSTTLIEIDGARVLTDPIWSERSSPTTLVGPERFHPPPLALRDLPHLDAVIISHEHYDHLDMATVRELAKTGVPFHVPLGVGAHLRSWGVPRIQVHEHDWWESETLGTAPDGLRIVSTPAHHFNGRGVPGRIGTFWTSWSLVGRAHRVFVSGDTGMTEAFREIGRREGPFDLALLEIGQFDRLWSDIHLGPQGALDAHSMLGARIFMPIHWATFQLGFHDWSEPAETLVREAERRHVEVVTPRLGEPIEPTTHPVTPAWWRVYPPMTARCP